MNDYFNLKDAFEMAEVLEDYTETSLEVKTVNADDTQVVSIFFLFNEDLELVRIYTQ